MIITLPILLPLAGALIAIALGHLHALNRWIGIATSLLTLLVSVILLAAVDKAGVHVLHVGGWEAPFGIALVADRFGAVMVAVSCLVAFCASIYALKDIDDSLIKKHFVPLFLLLLMGVNGAYLTGDLFNLYVWFEVLLSSSFVLLVLGSEQKQLKGSLKYVVLNLLGSTFFLLGAGLLYGKVGTLNMADLAYKLSSHELSSLVNTSGILLLLAFGLKAGVFPLFFWLPNSYPTVPHTVSALFAGLLTKVGIYAIIRSMTLFLSGAQDDMKELLIAVALLTMVFGVLGAVAQKQIRQILSFHIISQVGYILAGVALLTVAGLAGAIFYLVHHIIVKSNLFFIAGMIQHQRGSDDLSKSGNLRKLSPVLATLFFISAFSLAGLPLLSGFWAKLAVLKAGLQEEAWLLSSCVVLVGIVTLLSMLKIWIGSFWSGNGTSDSGEPIKSHPLPLSMLLPSILLAILTLGLGIMGGELYSFSLRAAEDLMDPMNIIAPVLKISP